ncbi:MAG: SEC-C metal-binding domain-containing protein [Pirellulaceae bacterium]
MNRRRVSRNDPCPCGSGRKFKKCCYNRDRRITQLDRAMAIELIERHVESCDERCDAINVFCGGFDLDVPAMTDHFRETSDSAFLLWFTFDFQLDDGSCVVDRVLKTNPVLSIGERRYLEQMRTTAMMPYEVLAVRPGVSVVLRRIGG